MIHKENGDTYNIGLIILEWLLTLNNWYNQTLEQKHPTYAPRGSSMFQSLIAVNLLNQNLGFIGALSYYFKWVLVTRNYS
jgi:hypothetical protein